MTTFKTLCIAGITALILPLGAATPASAQEAQVNFVLGKKDPFKVSEQNCIDKGWVETKCLTTNEASGVFPISLVIDQLNSNIERLRAVNGWGEEVTPDTLVPIGSTFAFG